MCLGGLQCQTRSRTAKERSRAQPLVAAVAEGQGSGMRQPLLFTNRAQWLLWTHHLSHTQTHRHTHTHTHTLSLIPNHHPNHKTMTKSLYDTFTEEEEIYLPTEDLFPAWSKACVRFPASPASWLAKTSSCPKELSPTPSHWISDCTSAYWGSRVWDRTGEWP